MNDLVKTIGLIALVSFVTISIANRIGQLRGWLLTDSLPASG